MLAVIAGALVSPAPEDRLGMVCGRSERLDQERLPIGAAPLRSLDLNVERLGAPGTG